MQETRSDEGTSLQYGVLRLCSGADRGHHGVEFWCNLRQPFARLGGKEQFLQRQHFTVAHRDPTRLLVKLEHPLLCCWHLVLHAPQSGQPFSARQLWWQETSSLLRQHEDLDTPVFIYVDANAGPGEPDGRSVLQPGFRTSSGTPLLRAFIDEIDLFVPIASPVHEGTVHTWSSPNEGDFTIDFVLIPHSWAHRCTKSQVLDDFDFGNTTADHSAVAIELSWHSTQAARRSPASHGPRFDRALIGTHLRDRLPLAQVAAWEEDAGTHLSGVNQHFLQHLNQKCAKPRRGPKKPYISKAIWDLRAAKLGFRAELKHCRGLLRRETLARIFGAWRRPLRHDLEQSFSFGTTLRLGTLKNLAAFRRNCRQLKALISQHKMLELQDVVNSFTSTTAASEIQQRLKPFMGPSNKTQQGLAPLPMIKDVRGRPCTSAQAAVARWVQFFSEMVQESPWKTSDNYGFRIFAVSANGPLTFPSPKFLLFASWKEHADKQRLGKLLALIRSPQSC